MTFMKHSKLVLVFFIGIIFAACGESTTAPAKEGSAASSASVTKAAAIPALQSGEEIAVIEVDGFRKIKLRLFSDVAPKHVESFKKLINEHFYDGLAFHRVLKDVMIQGGDPNTRSDDRKTWGMGQPDQPKLKAEFSNRPFVKGTLAAARSGDPDSASSQFFVCFNPLPSWEGQYTNFGQVIEGIGEVQSMSNAPVLPNTDGAIDQKLVIKRMYLEKYQAK
jgi:peptidyl-prolyl cis-trans isomerase B (cyclophilin B)